MSDGRSRHCVRVTHAEPGITVRAGVQGPPWPGLDEPAGPLASAIVTAWVPITLFAAGGMANVVSVMNPPDATEWLYVDFVAPASPSSATSFPLEPGQSFFIGRPVPTAVTAAAATPGHRVIAATW